MLAMLVQVLSVVPPRVQQYGSVLAITVELSDVSEANLAMLLHAFFPPLQWYSSRLVVRAYGTLYMHIVPEVHSYGGLKVQKALEKPITQ